MTTITLKPFTQANFDLYSGVDGECPLLASLSRVALNGVTFNYDIIVDDNCIQIYKHLDGELDGFYVLELNFKASQKLVKSMNPDSYIAPKNALDMTVVDVMARDYGMDWMEC